MENKMSKFRDYLEKIKVDYNLNDVVISEAKKKKKKMKPTEKLEPGDSLYKGTGTSADKLGVGKAAYRKYFLNIKNGLLASGKNAGSAIAIAYYSTNKHFKDLEKK
jgi:hypothetical protein